VNSTTTRVITRHFVTDADGRKTLNTITAEETHSAPGGRESMVRTVSNPDANGALQVTRRETAETVPTGAGVKETTTTVSLLGPNGGLAPNTKILAVERETKPGTIEYRKSVSFTDGSGGWQVNEVREGTIQKQADGAETQEERVSRLNGEGKLAAAERTVTQQSKAQNGEQRKQVQKYSTAIGGTTAYSDGGLHLDQQTTTVTRTGPGGAKMVEQQVEQRSSVSPDEPLRTTQRVLDISRTDTQGVVQQTETIESATPNGNLDTVWVDTRSTSGTPAVTVDTKSQTKQADTKKPQAKTPPAH